MIMDCCGGAKIRCEFSQTQINTDNIVLKTIFHNVPDSTLYVKPETIRKEIQEAFFDAATVLTDFSIKDTIKLDKPYTYLYINPSGKVMALKKAKEDKDANALKDAAITCIFDVIINMDSHWIATKVPNKKIKTFCDNWSKIMKKFHQLYPNLSTASFIALGDILEQFYYHE